jgi:hypothetical protein
MNYTVQEGDSLSSIAKRHRRDVLDIVLANRHRPWIKDTDGSLAFRDPLFVGEDLAVPCCSECASSGTTCSSGGQMGAPSLDDVKQLWKTSSQAPAAQIDAYWNQTFQTDNPALWGVGAEKVAVATAISSIAVEIGTVGAFTAFAPFMMPVVAFLAGITVDAINDFLSNFGIDFGSKSYCNHPEIFSKGVDDPHWIHYPARKGVCASDGANGRCTGTDHVPVPLPAQAILHVSTITVQTKTYGSLPDINGKTWGKLGLRAIRPTFDDYPWVTALGGIGPDLLTSVLEIPSAQGGSFESYWYPIYARVIEIARLQDCVRRDENTADKMTEAALVGFLNIWNRHHAAGPGQVFPPAAAGDDTLLSMHASALNVHRGAPIQVAHAGTSSGGSSSSTAANVVVGTGIVAGLLALLWALLGKPFTIRAVKSAFKNAEPRRRHSPHPSLVVASAPRRRLRAAARASGYQAEFDDLSSLSDAEMQRQVYGMHRQHLLRLLWWNDPNGDWEPEKRDPDEDALDNDQLARELVDMIRDNR